MQVKFKKLHERAEIPRYSKEGDAALDLMAVSVEFKSEYMEVRFGLAAEIPKGYFGLIVPRSSITTRDLMLKNSAGIIDSGYRGELTARFQVLPKNNKLRDWALYHKGERCAQLIILPYPKIEPVEVRELSDSERGDGGYGSTGN